MSRTEIKEKKKKKKKERKKEKFKKKEIHKELRTRCIRTVYGRERKKKKNAKETTRGRSYLCVYKPRHPRARLYTHT